MQKYMGLIVLYKMAYIFISILFDFRMQIIQPGTVAMASSAHGSQ
jgi:hypothetical protein